MSLEEMESTWGSQSAPVSDTAAAQAWIDKSRRAVRTTALFLLVTTLIAVGNLGLQLHRLAVDPDRTFANSYSEIALAALGAGFAIFGVVSFRLGQRKYRALMHDTRRCLELILQEKRTEITALTAWVPATLLGCLGLVALGKLQIIGSGLESPANAWSGVIFAAVFFLIISTVLIHRAIAFVKPEARELETTLRSLALD